MKNLKLLTIVFLQILLFPQCTNHLFNDVIDDNVSILYERDDADYKEYGIYDDNISLVERLGKDHEKSLELLEYLEIKEQSFDENNIGIKKFSYNHSSINVYELKSFDKENISYIVYEQNHEKSFMVAELSITQSLDKVIKFSDIEGNLFYSVSLNSKNKIVDTKFKKSPVQNFLKSSTLSFDKAQDCTEGNSFGECMVCGVSNCIGSFGCSLLLSNTISASSVLSGFALACAGL